MINSQVFIAGDEKAKLSFYRKNQDLHIDSMVSNLKEPKRSYMYPQMEWRALSKSTISFTVLNFPWITHVQERGAGGRTVDSMYRIAVPVKG